MWIMLEKIQLYSLDCPVQEKQPYLLMRLVSLSVMMNMDGLKMVFSTLKVVVMLRLLGCPLKLSQ